MIGVVLVDLGVVDRIAFGIGGVDGEGNDRAALRAVFQHHAHGVGIQTGFGLGGVEQGVNPAMVGLALFKPALGIEAGGESADLLMPLKIWLIQSVEPGRVPGLFFRKEITYDCRHAGREHGHYGLV